MNSILKKFFRRYFPKLYYSERVQKFLFYLFLPSPIKYIIFILIILIAVLIWNALSTDNAALRLTGYSIDKNEKF
ncbi:MAG TPA: hypothetical protein PKY81_13305 [bacterium]|nr:hypothetical protein [bacterium]HPN31925.1 hypothetical protein [bacterium]